MHPFLCWGDYVAAFVALPRCPCIGMAEAIPGSPAWSRPHLQLETGNRKRRGCFPRPAAPRGYPTISSDHAPSPRNRSVPLPLRLKLPLRSKFRWLGQCPQATSPQPSGMARLAGPQPWRSAGVPALTGMDDPLAPSGDGTGWPLDMIAQRRSRSAPSRSFSTCSRLSPLGSGRAASTTLRPPAALPRPIELARRDPAPATEPRDPDPQLLGWPDPRLGLGDGLGLGDVGYLLDFLHHVSAHAPRFEPARREEVGAAPDAPEHHGGDGAQGPRHDGRGPPQDLGCRHRAGMAPIECARIAREEPAPHPHQSGGSRTPPPPRRRRSDEEVGVVRQERPPQDRDPARLPAG